MFNLIVADPPWKYNNRVDHKDTPQDRTKFGGGAQAHYSMMSDWEIVGLSKWVQDVADDNCLLAMWVTGPKFDVGMTALMAWGFRYTTVGFTWVKMTDEGNPHTSPGYYTASNAEWVLFGVRGKTTFANKPAQALVNSVIMAPRLAHSAKPEEMQDRLDLMYPNHRKLELFARRERAGYVCLGNEITGNDIRKDLELLVRPEEEYTASARMEAVEAMAQLLVPQAQLPEWLMPRA